ncbi:hypothetical protein BDN67DRAFT_916066, partial [Paxillus ammoniavirescens]
IRCGRPRHPEETIPATLLHPVFGQFLDDSQTHVMTKEDNDFIEELANVMSDVYDTEQERVTKVYNVFRSHDINFNLGERVDGTDYVIDGAMSLDGHRYVIADFKNEVAASSSEPYMECAAYYLESTKKQALKMTASPLPCFLLVIFGPFMVFAGAVWNLHPDVQVLSTPLAFNYHSTDTHNQITAGRHVMAFRKAVRSLTQFYLQLVGEPASTLSPPTLSSPERRPTLFPHCTSFTSLDDGSQKRFRYKQQPHDDKLVFFGTLLEDTEVAICIKFVRRYSREAHSLCASLGFAPKLRGFEQVPGGWFLVVMDKLVGYKLLADLCDSPDSHPPESVFEAISDQLKHLHLGGFVHGDIRDTNIMLKEDDQKQFMIIDFDWAGKTGEVRYPPYVNGTDIWRPEGAHDGELIQAGHDDAMLNAIAIRHVIGE